MPVTNTKRPIGMWRLLALIALGLLTTSAALAERFTAADITAVQDVGDPQLSPDGDWVAYTVASNNIDKDTRITHVWMTSWDGKQTVQLTNSQSSEHTPRWRPDGQQLAFLASRGDDEAPEQVWILNRLGGEAQVLTEFKGDVIDFDWSPDGQRLALIVVDEDPQRASKADEKKTAPPIVIDRFYFKEDESEYLGNRRQHLYVFDLATRKAELLTAGRYDEGQPAWSPDGKEIAFVSKRSADPDRDSEFGLYAIAPTAGSTPRLIAKFQGEVGDSEWSGAPQWSPNGREIAYVTAGDPKLVYFSTHRLAVVPSAGGAPRILTDALDRSVMSPRWSADGRSIYLLVEDDRNQHLTRLNVASGKTERLLGGRRESTEFDISAKGRFAIIDSTVDRPPELFAVENQRARTLSRVNDALIAQRELAPTEEISVTSKDGTRVSGFIVKPPGFVAGRRYPTLLWIHGGPVSQYANSFMPMWQIFAARGYVVVATNPRGSSGRGEAFAAAIYANWGEKDTQDVLAAVDYAIDKGIADPERLGVGGWSYGGMLTNNVIARDTRFKAAVSGASTSNILAGYGTDMYTREYELELGTPWKNRDVYLRNSYPFLHADRIKTPTLFLCGERDFNVPLLNSEQMYQALRSLNIDTQLIIYPGQYHGLDKPSYLRDRMQRYLDWFGRYLSE
ncbi:MAG TPA: S9 family peptidase [Steroidobacteraceae bacterium]|nr:S9 family peptidase [Steroidobacteraceae bacterium]